MTTPINSDKYAALRQVSQTTSNPHYQAIGGEESIARLVDRFYFYMDSLPEAQVIRAMHEQDLTQTKAVLNKFLVEWLGGPKVYSVERGHPKLRQKHIAFSIGAPERDAWMLCMKRAMEDVIADATLKNQLEQAFFKTADFIRNDKGSNHA